MDTISLNLKKHYLNLFEKHGASAKGVDWKNKDQANLRHKIMLNVIREEDLKAKKTVSVLDVGCGYGEQYIFAKKSGLKIAYTGIDIVPQMIDYAQRKIKNAHFIYADIFTFSPKKLFDYVICNGILTQKLTSTDSQMDKFAKKLILKMFELARKGIVFNTMTTYVDFKTKGNYYVNPNKMISNALNLTRFVKVDHSYPLWEYSVYMYKENI